MAGLEDHQEETFLLFLRFLPHPPVAYDLDRVVHFVSTIMACLLCAQGGISLTQMIKTAIAYLFLWTVEAVWLVVQLPVAIVIGIVLLVSYVLPNPIHMAKDRIYRHKSLL